jgi:type I restriction enzyme S subunit
MCGTFEYGLNAAAKEFDGKNKYIRITDIDDASREFLLSDLSSPDICLDGMSKYLLSSGDIVFARTGASVGKTYIYRENDGIVYFAGFLIRAKVNQDNDAEFVFQSTLSPSYEKYIRITSQRSGQPGVNAQEYGEYDLFAPSKEEQQRIGHFLRGIDNLITLHQRQPFLHSPPDISLIVQLTPPFYTFSWEQRKLTEFVEFFSGLTYTPNDVQENGTLVLRSSNVSNGEVVDADNIYVNPQVVNSENVKVGDIVVVVRNGSRSLIGKHAQIKAFMPNTVIGAFMTGIRSECPEFTNALLNTSRFEEEIAMNMGATINQITGYMFSKMEFKVPRLDEQKKIGEYFEKLDNLITLHQRQAIVYAVIRSIRKVILAERQYFAPPMVRKSP